MKEELAIKEIFNMEQAGTEEFNGGKPAVYEKLHKKGKKNLVLYTKYLLKTQTTCILKLEEKSSANQ